MSLNSTKFITKIRFPVIFGSALLTVYVGFTKRRYLLGDLTAEAELLCKEDPESRRLLEELEAEYNC